MTESIDLALSGAGNAVQSVAALHQLETVQSICDTVVHAPPRGVAVRGNGSTPADAAQNGGGAVVQLGGALSSPNRITINSNSYTAQLPAGLSVDAASRHLLAYGWYFPVSPDSRRMTIGGALARDIFGTNHLTHGTFASAVNALWLVDGTGHLRTLRPDDESADLFWATIGGLGLTGIITAIDIKVIPVSSAWLRVESTRFDSLDEVMTTLSQRHPHDSYNSAWLDLSASGAKRGRGVVTSGLLAHVTELPPIRQHEALELEALAVPSISRFSVRSVINNTTVRAINEMRFRAASPVGHTELQPISTHLNLRDSAGHLTRTHGKRGFIAYQFCVPTHASEAINRAIDLLSEHNKQCLWSVLQQLGPANRSPMSFAREGWALDLEYPADLPGLSRSLDAVDELVLGVGGRVNLSRDTRTRPQLVAAMYPEIAQWQQARSQLDPHGAFANDMARRLYL